MTKQMSDWKPIKEYNPNDHEIVLLCMPDNTYRLCAYYEDAGFIIDGSDSVVVHNAKLFFIPPTPEGIF